MDAVAPPADRSYSASHTWAMPAGDGTVRVGITHVAAALLGDAVYLEMPPESTPLRAGEPVGLIESSWVVFEVVSPLSGTLVEVNPAVAESPERATSDPYGEGWLFRLGDVEKAGFDALLPSGRYLSRAEPDPEAG
jgi:glycine cleavage system H protein